MTNIANALLRTMPRERVLPFIAGGAHSAAARGGAAPDPARIHPSPRTRS